MAKIIIVTYLNFYVLETPKSSEYSDVMPQNVAFHHAKIKKSSMTEGYHNFEILTCDPLRRIYRPLVKNA